MSAVGAFFCTASLLLTPEKFPISEIQVALVLATRENGLRNRMLQ
jgi:hypothetical protein